MITADNLKKALQLFSDEVLNIEKNTEVLLIREGTVICKLKSVSVLSVC